MTWLEQWFLHPEMLLLLLAVPVVLFLKTRAQAHRLARLVAITGGHDLALVDRQRRRWLDRGMLLALVLIIVGSAGPRLGRDPEVPPGLGRDIVVALDVSRSMLAEDTVGTSRLERAKERLYALVDPLQRRGGYRVALIVFAGRASVMLHLSDDYDAFRYALAEAAPDSIPAPERVVWLPDGESYGTSLRAALELAARTHDPEARGFQEILLVSDGDDLAGDWSAAMATSRNTAIRVSVLAVGDPEREALIPTGKAEEPFLTYAGQPVRTRRLDAPLRQIAEATGGEFVAEEQGPRALVAWFQQSVARRPEREWFADRIPQYRHRFAWFFAAALILVGLELLASDRRKERAMRDQGVSTLATVAAFGLFVFGSDPCAPFLRQGNLAFARGDYAGAMRYYELARERSDDPGRVAFARGAALYQVGKFAEAEMAYRQTLEDAKGRRRAAALYALGNSLVRQAEYLPGRVAVQKLREALDAYQACLEECHGLRAEERGSLPDDAVHNLEQAQLLLTWKRAEAEKADESDPQDPSTPRQEHRPGNPPTQPEPNQPPSQRPRESRPFGAQPQVTDQTRPGKGNLPPLLDDLSAPVLSHSEAEEYLRVHLERIHAERARRRASQGTSTEGRDW